MRPRNEVLLAITRDPEVEQAYMTIPDVRWKLNNLVDSILPAMVAGLVEQGKETHAWRQECVELLKAQGTISIRDWPKEPPLPASWSGCPVCGGKTEVFFGRLGCSVNDSHIVEQ